MSTNSLQKRAKLASIAFKINRIRKQEQFRRTHNHRYHSLTNREKEILQCLAEGANNPAIGEKLFISRRTVEQHRKHINQKLIVKSHADIWNYALAFNLV